MAWNYFWTENIRQLEIKWKTNEVSGYVLLLFTLVKTWLCTANPLLFKPVIFSPWFFFLEEKSPAVLLVHPSKFLRKPIYRWQKIGLGLNFSRHTKKTFLLLLLAPVNGFPGNRVVCSLLSFWALWPRGWHLWLWGACGFHWNIFMIIPLGFSKIIHQSMHPNFSVSTLQGVPKFVLNSRLTMHWVLKFLLCDLFYLSNKKFSVIVVVCLFFVWFCFGGGGGAGLFFCLFSCGT